jgi:hypothetical protein
MAPRLNFSSALLPAALALIMAGASAAPAQTVDWKAIDGWDISFYPDSAGCQAYARFEEGTAFFIGFDNTDDILVLDVTLLDNNWTSIRNGEEYPIEVRFGNESPWTMDMDGVVMNGHPGLNIMIDAASDEAALFIEEFQGTEMMEWRFGDASLGRYALTGSRPAFDEVIACQRSYLDAASSPSDPFASTTGKADPFSN